MRSLHQFNGPRAIAHLDAEGLNLLFEGSVLTRHLRQLACEYDAEFLPHLIAQLCITLGFCSLAFEGIHLPRDFVENVVDTRQILPRMLQAQLGKSLLSLEPRDARSFFDNRAPIVRLARENLADASLLDDCVRLRAKAGAHENVLYVAQTAELAVQQIFGFT